MVLQIILSVVALVIGAVILFLVYRARKNERQAADVQIKRSIDTLGEMISKELAEMVRDDDISVVSDSSYQAYVKNKRTIANALDECVYGVTKAKNIVKYTILHILERELPDDAACNEIIDFEHLDFENPGIQWEVLIYLVQKHHRTNPMNYLADTYGIIEERTIPNEINGEMQKRRLFDAAQLNEILHEEMQEPLTHHDKLEVIATMVYQKRYGFGCVDTIRGIDIDGFNFGTSGSVRYIIDGNFDVPYTTTNSVWVQMRAKWVHFSFLDFEKEAEMKRVVNQLVAWGTTAPMTEKSPYKVNDAYDGARVTAIRPPAGECWACCIRKFSSGLYVKEKLLKKPGIHNWELPSTLMYYLMKGEQTTAFTGQQNTGKTSMMKAAMADVAMVNIRILEMSFELAIRELYPWKNVITVKPTDYVSASELQDLLKKTDGYLSMVGEVAQDIVAARMIQFCLIASAFTIFSHHARDDYSLVNGLANSLVACGEYENHDVAISTVLDAIKNNVHLDFVKDQRVIAYISEIVKLSELEPYPELSKSGSTAEAIDQLAMLQREFFTRTTDRVRFETHMIIRFNPETMTYEPWEGYSPDALKSILSHLHGQDRKNFINWYRTNWAHAL